MGLRYCLDYVGYESTCLGTMIDLFDRFCHGCHTNEDLGGTCENCPIGKSILAFKKYMLEAHESKYLVEEAEILRKIKKEIVKINPKPLFDCGFVFEKTRRPDSLNNLRELLKDLRFIEQKRTHPLYFWGENKRLRRIYKIAREEEIKEFNKAKNDKKKK